VSIKNKLVTAITTAGLLAGLFGSAFVPAARAVIDAAEEISCAADGDTSYQTAVNGIAYVTAGASLSCTIRLDGTDGLHTIGVAGTGVTIVSIPTKDAAAAAADTHAATAATIWSINSAATSASAILDFIADAADEATDDMIFVVNVKAPTTGTGYIDLYDGTALTANEIADLQLTVTTVAAGVPDGSYSQISEKCAVLAVADAGGGDTLTASTTDKVVADTFAAGLVAADDNLNDLVAAGGTYCTSSTGVPAVAAGDAYFIQVKAYDGFNVAVPEAENVGITATLSAGSPAGVEVLDLVTSVTGDVDDDLSDTLAETDGLDYVVITGDGDAGTATVTITVGALTYTRSVIFLGDTASIALSGPSAIVSGVTTQDENNAYLGDALVVVAKDDAGTTIGDGGGLLTQTAAALVDGDMGAVEGVSFTVTRGGANVSSSFNVVDNACDGTLANCVDVTPDNDDFSDLVNVYVDADAAAAGAFDVDTGDVATEALNGAYDMPYTLCGATDAGKTVTIKATIATVESNTVSITCVANKVKITSLNALATGTSGSATSGANGQTIKVSVAATDGSGRPAGAGSAFTFTATGSGGSTSDTKAIFSGGSATLTITLGTISGAQSVIYTATDSDTATTGSQAFAQKISFTVTNAGDALVDYALTKSGAKVTGSNFAARATVKVEVENASKGTVKVYTRKANAAGKVIYTIAGRGTFYVTMYTGAVGAEVLSNTVTVKR